jgi:peptidyl-tRNA hydrolase
MNIELCIIHTSYFMAFILVGLGNPGSEYENTRHNTGRIVLDAFRRAHDFPDWKFDKKLSALVSAGSVSRSSVQCQLSLVLPETFMNKSGDAVKQIKDSRLRRPARSRNAGGSGFGGQVGFKI